MKAIKLTSTELQNARTAVKSRIPASDRPWQKSMTYDNKREYSRKAKHKGKEDWAEWQDYWVVAAPVVADSTIT